MVAKKHSSDLLNQAFLIPKKEDSWNGMVLPGLLEERFANVNDDAFSQLERKPFYSIIFLQAGHFSVKIGLGECCLSPNDVVVIPPNILSSLFSIRNCKGFFIQFSEVLMD